MKKALQSKLFRQYSLMLASVFFISSVVYLFVSYGMAHYYLQQVQTRIHLNMADTLIEDHRLVEHGKLDESAVSKTFERYMLLNPSLQIYLLDQQGNILRYAADKKKILRSQVSMQPIKAMLNQPDSGKWPLGDDPRSLQEKKPFSVARLPNKNGEENYYLYVIIQDSIEEDVNRQLQESLMLKLGVYALGFSLLIGLLLGVLLFSRLIRRIAFLSDKIQRFRQDLAQDVPPAKKNRNELDQLQNDMSALSSQIQTQVHQLEQSDEQRRFLLSRLSHDLRTPLTNLLGYMEQAEKQGTDPYLSTAYQNGLKLKHYLDQLFDFAKIDLQSFMLTKEELSLSEFCFDLFSDYLARNPNPDWKIDVSDNYLYEFDPVYMESALINLFDNALKYGQGEVCFALKPVDEGVVLSVCSQGEPLEASTEKQLTSSSFQIDSGLGLSIVRVITEKHGGQFCYVRRAEYNCFEIRLPALKGS
ncbi:sensor histidine kinase [Thiomicrorhabdus heinhorstiae]|uniref:histidine kinase n=1 Tax=Thiomicrorhabdus heinhorstiae TaxID=2748010 RepID=A0ABS0BWQ8_9GAMM|nr:HAMP domain-containing sensor histidine kinase [Thiomicrorhabdus heinhorstiae]MBF6057500.1 HAMP domain-containing histidine kinase [Thiomicrorhabdus heinhorstiae]